MCQWWRSEREKRLERGDWIHGNYSSQNVRRMRASFSAGAIESLLVQPECASVGAGRAGLIATDTRRIALFECAADR